MRIRLLTFGGCPSGPLAADLLRQILRGEGIADPVEQVDIPDLEAARNERFLGSPTIQIDGMDIEVSRRADPPYHGCRLYATDKGSSGLPPEEMIREAVRRAKVPRLKVLFLCTGNACRSQMAEGWTRHLKAGEVEAYSAGSAPERLDPRAVEVMAEASVDISGQRSKHVDEFKGQAFDYVITLCGEAEVACPLFGGTARRLHAPFDDPPVLARSAASEEEALGHYRRVRDEIRAFVESLPGILKGKDE